MIVLDTHIWIWLVMGHPRLGKTPTLEAIRKSLKKDEVFVPAISVWEVAMLYAKGRLKIPEPVADWITKAFSIPGLNMLSLTPLIAADSATLPGFHGDPADRLIVASARSLHASLATFDNDIRKWASSGYLETV